MRVLVTGGAGYIGSHTAKALAANGFEPVVLDNLSTGNRKAVRWGPFVHGDIGDRELVRRVLREHAVEGVIHFAASAYVGESVLHPRTYFRNNVTNMLALLEEMVDAGVDRMIFSSSCATYGIPETLPITEHSRQDPVNPYGHSKLFGERMLSAFGDAYGLQWVALRYFNAAGADPEGEIGESHDPETHLTPLVIDAALQRRPAVAVYGTDYPTHDGTAVRDYVHVTDLADAHLRALHYLRDGGESTALNLGTGTGYSVLDIISAVQEVGGRPVPACVVARRPGDPPALVADAAGARDLLGWVPMHSDLRTIVQTAWDWRTAGSIHERLGASGGAEVPMTVLAPSSGLPLGL